MAIMAVCGAVLVAALVLGVRWSGREFRAPPADGPLGAAEAARRFVWYASLALVAGPAVGIAVIGCGGRLAMRLLAVTAGDDAQGRITEAEEVVGRITADGTIGFVVFNGILGGLACAAAYLLVRRLLPAGWLGGVVFGLGLLVVLGTVVDPLRDENPDFDIVGPGWLSAVLFAALAVAFGVVLAAVTARVSAWLPLPANKPRVLLRYIPPALVAGLLFIPVTAALVVVGAVVVVATRWRGLVDAVRSPRAVLVGRVLAIGLVVVSLPSAVTSVADIATR
jgi:hypothetical protein